MKSHNVFWSEFLGMYKSFPVLWKMKSKNYCNREEKTAAYDKLIAKLKEFDPEANRGLVTRKINSFRTSYRRELGKLRKAKKSGTVFQSTLWYFDLLHFLADDEVLCKAKITSSDDSVNDGCNELCEPPIKRKTVKKYEKLKENNNTTSVLGNGWPSQYTHNKFWAEFLEIYKSLPVLWKVKSKNYGNRMEKAAAYDKLVDKLEEIDPEANRGKVIKKINIFRTNYRRELRKIKNTKNSGTGTDYVFQPTLWYFDLLHFLSDQEIHSNTKSTISAEDDSMSDGSIKLYEPLVKRKTVKKDEILKVIREKLKENNDTATVRGNGWPSQYANNKFWSEFLEIYKSLPVLWNVKSKNYANRMEKAAAYDKLVDKLAEIDPEANRGKVIKKINIFRTSYWRELRKIKNTKNSGTGTDDKFQSTLWYFDLLHFLSDQEVHSNTKSTISAEDDSVSDGSREMFESPVKRKKVNEDEILQMAYERLKESNDASYVLAKAWVSQYEELANEQRVLARTIWADVLFHGCMNRLTEKMVEDIHQILKRSSNILTSSPTPLRSSTSYYEEYSFSPQSPESLFVACQQSDETLISSPTKSE